MRFSHFNTENRNIARLNYLIQIFVVLPIFEKRDPQKKFEIFENLSESEAE